MHSGVRRVIGLLGASLAPLLAGCALAPDSIRPELEHLSHASQHFGPAPTNYGADLVNIIAHWDAGKHLTLEVGEGIALERRDEATQSFGEIVGPREEFTARIAWVFEVKR